jgi:hypothetical protein
MRHFMILVSILVVILVGPVTPTANLSTIAQEGTPNAMADHPVVGAWRFDTNVDDPANPPSYAIFHADGTYTESHPTVGTGIGVWEPTGERTADLTIVFPDLDPTEAGFTRGELTIHAAVEVDENGNVLTAPYTFEGTDLDGATLFADTLTATATRIEGEPMVPLGTPVP